MGFVKAAVALSLCLALAQDKSFGSASVRLAQDKDLAGHWKLDEGKEAKAACAAGGTAGTLVKEPKWAEGKSGGALAFDGTEKYVEIPNSESLENVQEGNYTLALWFKPENLPPGAEEENNGSYCLLTKMGWHMGLRYNPEGKFVMDHWLKGEKPDEPVYGGGGTWENTYEPGKWYHVAGIVDKAAGSVKVYVNGDLGGAGEFEAGKAAREYGQVPWRIGIAGPGQPKWSWPAKGLIDDVRIYKKALTEDEVKALAK